MITYACLVKKVDDSSWLWSGFAAGDFPLMAASNLAVGVEGYDMPTASDRRVVERFIDDGWRFKLIEVNTKDDGQPITFDNHEIG